MRQTFIFTLSLLLLLFCNLFILDVYAQQQCVSSEYKLDVETSYNETDNILNIVVTNPKPLLNDGTPLNFSQLSIEIYNGDALVKEETYNNIEFSEGESQEFNVGNLPNSFGSDIVVVVVRGVATESASLSIPGIGGFGFNISGSLPSGTACGDDVLVF
ncbi:MAG: hypothetical protein SVN78_07165 [Deferribacterota bacterium]|nr:hypothetical protein [Deferribacterota bacterium]